MAFIMPVVRKDYNLYPSVAQIYQREKKNAVKDVRLTKSLPQFPISASKSVSDSCRHRCSQKLVDSRNSNGLADSCTASEHFIRADLQRHPPSMLGKEIFRRATFPPSHRDVTRLSGVRALKKVNSDSSHAALTDIQHSTGEKTPDVIKKNLMRSVGELLNIRVPSIDSGYSTSEPASPISDSSPTTSIMSAPTSPNLQRSSLRRPKMNITDKENKKATSAKNYLATEEQSPTLTARHVHFGFCEQIEYECQNWEGEPPKYGKLKRLERRLAAQLKNTLFRPRANSFPTGTQPPSSPLCKNQDKVSNFALKSDVKPVSKKLSVDEHLRALNIMSPPVVSSH